jgi:hypothetical protein
MGDEDIVGYEQEWPEHAGQAKMYRELLERVNPTFGRYLQGITTGEWADLRDEIDRALGAGRYTRFGPELARPLPTPQEVKLLEAYLERHQPGIPHWRCAELQAVENALRRDVLRARGFAVDPPKSDGDEGTQPLDGVTGGEDGPKGLGLLRPAK